MMKRNSMEGDSEFEPEVERDSELHCHISRESKKYLTDLKKTLKHPLGKIVDKIIRKHKARSSK